MIKARRIKIGKHVICESSPVFIIAEAGVNHNGSLRLAKKMIDAAKMSGADAVKFQTFRAEELVTRDAPKARYQNKSAPGKSQFAMLKRLELSPAAFRELFNYAKRKRIIFLSTPFDTQSAVFLDKLGVPAFKISSGDLTNLPLLRQIAQYGKPIILSTGMSTLCEVKEALQLIYSQGNKMVALLHCTSNYPTKYEDVNLRAMDTLKKRFKVSAGYSDHTKGIAVAIAAAALGACVIEKHFTLDKGLPGPDHQASLEPEELGAMVKAIRNIEQAMGSGVKAPLKSEIEIRKVVRKSIVAARAIPKGAAITQAMLTVKRPGTGIEPKFLNRLIGRCSKAIIQKDDVLTWDLIL